MTTLIAHLAAFFAHPLWERIVWTLLHSLWQGALIAVIVALILRRLPALRTDARHAVTLAGFAALALALPITFAALTGWNAWTTQHHAAPSTLAQSAPLPPALPSVAHSPPAPVPSTAAHSDSPNSVAETPQASETFRGWVAWIALLWLLGTTLMLIRTASSLIATRALLRTPALPDHHPLTDTLRTLAARMRLTGPIRLAESDRIATPCVAGLLRPVILLPITALTNLDESQLRAILAHELAHIRRKDLLVALLQRIIESILFFNPGALWLGRQLRVEREACCDALAAEAIDDPHAVARTLAHVAAASRAPAPFPTAALAMTGPDDAPLLQRIRRLLLPNERIPARLPWPSFLAVTLIACASLFTLTITAAQVGETAAKLLKPEERIAQAREIAGEFSDRVVDDPRAQENLVTIKGRVRTADGSPLPERSRGTSGQANVVYKTSDGSTTSAGYGFNINPDGSFSVTLVCGTTTLSAYIPGLAPTQLKPIHPKPGETIENVEIVLDRGETARVIVVDATGHPIPNVEVKKSQLIGHAWLGAATVPSDQDGLAVLENLAPKPVRLSVQHPGYESEAIEVSLTEDEPYTWRLTPTKPLVVTLYDRSKPTQDGFVPLADAEILLAFDTQRMQTHDPRDPNSHLLEQIPDLRSRFPGKVIATTDLRGQFEIDSLQADTQYLYWVHWDEKYQLLPWLTLADSPAEIVVDPPIWIEGEVRGDLSKLRTWNEAPRIDYRDNWIVKKSLSTFRNGHEAFALVDPETRRFRIGPLVAQAPTAITAGHIRRNIDAREFLDELLIIDLDQPKPERKIREVIVALIPPAGWPAPEGTILGNELRSGEYYYAQTINEVTDGVARVRVNLPSDGSPGKFSIAPHSLPGYWFVPVQDMDIPQGVEPYEFSLPVQPAGSVHGRVTMPNGLPASRIMVTLYQLDSQNDQTIHIEPQTQTTSDGRFVVNGIPLNRTFCIGVNDMSGESERRILSDRFTFTEHNLTREITLQFVDGVDLDIRFLDPLGDPIRRIRPRLIYHSPYRHSHLGSDKTPDANGRVVWKNINPDLPGEHIIEVQPTHDTIGHRHTVDVSRPVQTIQLVSGMRTTGQIIDASTGMPIPDALITLSPDFSSEHQPLFPGELEIITDAEGRFDVRYLEPVPYRLQQTGFFPLEAVFNEDNRTISYRGTPSTLTITGGELDQTIRVAIAPWSSHTPAPAAN